MDKVKIVAKNLLLTLVLLVVATLPLQIAIIITSVISMFDVSHITLYQPLAFALGLMGEGFVLFVLRQEFKGDKARLQQVIPLLCFPFCFSDLRSFRRRVASAFSYF